MRDLRQILNIVYAYLTEGLPHDALEEYDGKLAAAPGAAAPPPRSRGTEGLMGMMGGGQVHRPPLPAGAGGRS